MCGEKSEAGETAETWPSLYEALRRAEPCAIDCGALEGLNDEEKYWAATAAATSSDADRVDANRALLESLESKAL